MMVVEGRVWEIPSGRGLGGICVSNGDHIVQTDTEGRYALEIEPGDHRFVCLTVPDGFRSEGDFYRSTLGWMGPQQDVDFGLVPAPERAGQTFSVAHLADTHVGGYGDSKPLGRVVARDLQQLVEDAAPDLIVVCGDLTDWGTPPELNSYREAIRTVSTPVFSLFGGHDGNKERFGDLTIEELVELKSKREYAKIQEIVKKREGTTFTRNFEQALGPAYYSFDWGGRHFVLNPTESFFSPADERRKDSWFEADLELQPPDREIIVLVHKPPSPSLLEQLSRYNTVLVLYGHWHSSKVYTHGKIVIAVTPPLSFGGLDASPRGYRLVRFGEDGLTCELKALRESGVPSKPVDRDLPTSISLGGRGQMSLLWEHRLPVGLHRAAPVPSGDKILLSLGDERHPGGSGVYCLDSRTGAFRWRTPTDTSVENSVTLVPSAPAKPSGEGEELCVTASVAGRVHVLETGSGEVRWQTDLPGFPDRWISASPAVANGTVYAGGKSGYGAYDLETGEQQWYTPGVGGDGWPCYASPEVRDGLLVALIQRRGLVAFDGRDGTVAWEQELGVENPYGRPVVTGDLLVTGSNTKVLHHYTGEPAHLAVLRWRSGDVVWNRPILPARYPTGLMVLGGRIYAGTPDGEAFCFDLDSGDLQWRFQTADDLLDMIPARRGVRSILAAPMAFGDYVLICGCDGCLYVLDSVTGVCETHMSFGSPISASPCPVDDGFCVGTYDGRLYCFGSSE